MGVHVEWFDARYMTTRILAAGQSWDGGVPDEHEDDDTVNAGNVAVTFGTDSVVVIEGTPERIREILTAALDRLNAAEPGLRLEYLRAELRAERISQGELIELQNLVPHIDAGDVELLEAAGVSEHAEE